MIEKFLHQNAHASLRWIAQKRVRLVEPLDHKEMIETPEDHAGKLTLKHQLLTGAAIGLGLKPVLTGGYQDTLGIRTVAIDATGTTQLRQGHNAAVIAKDRCQRGSSAFGCLVLQNRCGLDPS